MIKRIYIENFKSLEKVSFNYISNPTDVICLIGKNGAGKSNVFKAINYFFKYINKPYSAEKIIDNSNPYIQKCVISVVFDLTLLKKKAEKNQNLQEKFYTIDQYIRYNYEISWENIDEIELQMIQYKDGFIKWSIDNHEICETLKTVFPLYYIDSRYLDIFTWEKMWEIISDLSAVPPKIGQPERNEIIDDAFSKIYGEKYTSSKDRIKELFEKNKITLDPYHFDTKYKNAFSMRFGGEQFLIDGMTLDYYSDGTSYFKYLLLLTSLIPQISENSCKFPIILIDEPEIGLHNDFITKFVKCISDNIHNNALLILNTHSPKLIVDFTYYNIKYSLYKVNKKGLHSKIHKMNISWLKSSDHRITVKETECYFYDYLVYVEGETEVQLFNHPKICDLFEKFHKIHFYSFDSNDQRLRSVHSDSLSLGVPYKVLIDMDKVLNYSDKTNKFSIKGDKFINPLINKKNRCLDYYSYKNNSGVDKLKIRQNIELYLKKNYVLIASKNYISNIDFNFLMENVQKYCYQYNVIVNWSTIEGELITYENIDKFIKFASTQKISSSAKSQHDNICAVTDIKEKAVLILSEYCGKTEIFKNAIFKGKKVEKIIQRKTSGWVMEWIDYYFENYLEKLPTNLQKKAQFKKDFPSLFNTLQMLENMVY